MLLGKVNFLDIAVFLVFVSWCLLRDVGFYVPAIEALSALPFLAFELPCQILYERYLSNPKHRLAWTLRASLFQDVVVRCVRYAFRNIDPKVGRVFLSKDVALPFLRFRIWRHPPSTTSISWDEVEESTFKGVWVYCNREIKPDMVLYYIHGGGFVMGSTYFYLEFLIALNVHLRQAGFENPAIFALDYTLVPDAVYPIQLKEALAGYEHVLSKIDYRDVCVGGDSAGGTLILSLLLHMADYTPTMVPKFATLFSPWTVLVSNKRNTASDYLDAQRLNCYGKLYAGKTPEDDTTASPGCCKDLDRWKRAMPTNGLLCIYGTEELLYDEICMLLEMLERVGSVVRIEEEAIHVWPIAVVFLGAEAEERHRSLEGVARLVRERMR
ncbi:hypothetical protein BDZ91DRAFT_724745 [Kalaharituber pfeilii]|nr:hypothetical protein BDZ91DRAFT_724745 [Kalaharituber pfeilii]